MTPEENQFSDIPFWLQRNWTTFSAQPYYGMRYWLTQGETNRY